MSDVDYSRGRHLVKRALYKALCHSSILVIRYTNSDVCDMYSFWQYCAITICDIFIENTRVITVWKAEEKSVYAAAQ
jgi:hypothetical protein